MFSNKKYKAVLVSKDKYKIIDPDGQYIEGEFTKEEADQFLSQFNG
jgi:hypothetical protein